MSVESISGNMAALRTHSLGSGTSWGGSVSVGAVVKDPTPAKAEIQNAVDPQADDKVTLSSKPLSVAKAANSSKPAGVVSHVVVSYNLRGEMRTKFVDSRNNVVYQMPSEMVAKMQDLMMTVNTSTNVKG
ncbi:MAG: hypothetical protein PHI31_12260 [Desulfuromonadaceae bacterium]|nr:hypothetical protein [Desulfuromonadaceae bacterium]